MPFTRKRGKILYSQTSHRWQYMRFACRITKARIQTHTHTLRIFNTHYISTAIMVYANAPRCYLIRSLHVLLESSHTRANNSHVEVIKYLVDEDLYIWNIKALLIYIFWCYRSVILCKLSVPFSDAVKWRGSGKCHGGGDRRWWIHSYKFKPHRLSNASLIGNGLLHSLKGTVGFDWL